MKNLPAPLARPSGNGTKSHAKEPPSDPGTDQIVWQYGRDRVVRQHAQVAGQPRWVDLLPPFSYADRYQPQAAPTP